ncbi:MAG: ADP-forming succinate--CoA ligase subunit beta, partial [Planctomycetes bacterium]|nr:ADP-forming succinate--CoA ligase subunit beta [Planctomycetota bacterium]
MKIHEYQAKQLLSESGIPTPQGILAVSAEEAEQAAEKIGTPCAVKAQVHTGGRGKAGGIKLAQSSQEAGELARQILQLSIKDIRVKKLWIEEAVGIKKELYLSLAIDRSSREFLFICSDQGGIEIEQVAAENPGAILKFRTASREFPLEEAQEAAGKIFADSSHVESLVEIMQKIFKLALAKDTSLIEINPLVLTDDDRVIALDAKVDFDDNALFRHPDILELRDMDQEVAAEIRAKEMGLSFVQLDGDIGCMVNGAGLAMCTMDTVKLFGGRPANFLDVGGSSNPQKVVDAFNLILESKKVKAIL